MVSEDSDQLMPGFLTIHRLSNLDDFNQPLAVEVMISVNEFDDSGKLLKVELL